MWEPPAQPTGPALTEGSGCSVDLRKRILRHARDRAGNPGAEEVVRDLLEALGKGKVRAADRDGSGTWFANAWVKEGLLLGFRIGRLQDVSAGGHSFLDKHTYPLKRLGLQDGVRLVPGGSAIRSGAYVASGVVCMPPMYVNTGAYVDGDTMIDSHALVGSCAQIGKRVHLSAAAQIGGVLEPAGALPVIIEDDVFVGGGCGVYEGCIVRRAAVLAPGVALTGSTRIYDLVRQRVIEPCPSLEVPEGAVVVPGTRAASGPFAQRHGLGLYAPVIVKYRDSKTDAAVALESTLR